MQGSVITFSVESWIKKTNNCLQDPTHIEGPAILVRFTESKFFCVSETI